MWQFESGSQSFPELMRLAERATHLHEFFRTDAPVVVARAPGRLDLMGGIADYSGALVLELPLAVAAGCAAQADPAPVVHLHSAMAATIGAHADVRIDLEALTPQAGALSYAAAHTLLTSDPHQAWAAYVAGVLVVLHRERGLRPPHGVRLLLDSDVPPGKGVSSSAAIEVASMRALAALFGLELAGRDLAILCQKVENLVVGAPCGVMDQMTSACGEHDRLLALLCQPAELHAAVPLPEGVEVWGIDSGIRHAVSGSDYTSVRVGAFMGYRMIADLAGLPVNLHDGRAVVDDPRWHGYLANVTPSEWETFFRDRLPETISGAEFLERYAATTDPVTRVDPARTYALRQPTAHPIYEHQRVRLFAALLAGVRGSEPDDETLSLLGELMYQSHASYSACGLGSDGTDRLVALVRAAGPARGLFGAKITGGGSGGTVAVLARRGGELAVRSLAAAYERETGLATTLLGGSSPGAMQTGTFRMVWSE